MKLMGPIGQIYKLTWQCRDMTFLTDTHDNIYNERLKQEINVIKSNVQVLFVG